MCEVGKGGGEGGQGLLHKNFLYVDKDETTVQCISGSLCGAFHNLLLTNALSRS